MIRQARLTLERLSPRYPELGNHLPELENRLPKERGDAQISRKRPRPSAISQNDTTSPGKCPVAAQPAAHSSTESLRDKTRHRRKRARLESPNEDDTIPAVERFRMAIEEAERRAVLPACESSENKVEECERH